MYTCIYIYPYVYTVSAPAMTSTRVFSACFLDD